MIKMRSAIEKQQQEKSIRGKKNEKINLFVFYYHQHLDAQQNLPKKRKEEKRREERKKQQLGDISSLFLMFFFLFDNDR